MASEAKQQKLDGSTNKPSISLVWLDGSIGESDTNISVEVTLREFDPNLQTFKDKDECEQYLKSPNIQARIVLIVNGQLGQEIIKNIEYLQHIIAIYIYCWDKEKHEKWAKECAKIKGVVNKIEDLKEIIQTNHFSIVNEPTKEQLNAETGEVDFYYFISDNSMNYVSQIKETSKDKDDFVLLCQTEAKESFSDKATLEKFQENYSSDQTLSLLGKHSAFTKILNKSFKSTSTEAIYNCRFFLRDIRKQFDTHKCTTSVQVYRGELMNDQKFQELKRFEGKIMAVKSFYFTTLSRSVAKSYIRDLPNMKRVLFEIEADPQITDVKPFVKTNSFPKLKDKDGVIFMIGSLFKINKIQDDGNNLTIVKMVLCANEDEDPFRDQLNNTNDEKDLIGYAQLLCNMGVQFAYPTILGNADEVLRKCLNELPDDHSDRIRCYDTLGNISFARKDLDSSLSWYEKSLEMKKKILSSNDPNIAATYENIASVYLRKRDGTKALDALKQAFMISEQIYADDQLKLIYYYDQFIKIYESDGKFNDALSYHFQIFSILSKHFDIEDPNLAIFYNNIGKTYFSLGQHALALGYYETSLKIKLDNASAFPRESVALAHKGVASVYKRMGNTEQALNHYKESLKVYSEVCSPNDGPVLELGKIIQNFSSTSK